MKRGLIVLLLLAFPVYAADDGGMLSVWAAMAREAADLRATISEQQGMIRGLQRKVDVLRGRSDCA